ncbi:SRPBCC family protein [Amycolatopsis thermoflava]|uniref:SRPBCC family protein n=1 Tax=Amycolatopsis thermoflava TaxID=84480 RepID=UPI003EB99C34
MPTITESISIAATPQTVFDLVSDPSRLPKWAPGVDATRVRVRASREHGTVDFFAADNPDAGVYTRVLPNGEGAEYQFTMFFQDGTPETVVAEQASVVRGELDTVRTLCE